MGSLHSPRGRAIKTGNPFLLEFRDPVSQSPVSGARYVVGSERPANERDLTPKPQGRTYAVYFQRVVE